MCYMFLPFPRSWLTNKNALNLSDKKVTWPCGYGVLREKIAHKQSINNHQSDSTAQPISTTTYLPMFQWQLKLHSWDTKKLRLQIPPNVLVFRGTNVLRSLVIVFLLVILASRSDQRPVDVKLPDEGTAIQFLSHGGHNIGVESQPSRKRFPGLPQQPEKLWGFS